MEQLDDVITALAAIVAGFDPQLVDGAEAARLVKSFTKVVRLASAGRALAAGRVKDTNAWKAEGFRSAEEWLAAKTKTSQSSASETLRTARQIDSLPATRAALVSGQVSEEQAAAIASAATADPAAEDRLLHEADRGSLRGLQRTARDIRAAAARDQAEGRDRVHRSRYLRQWSAADGAVEGRFRLTSDQGAVVLAALDVEQAEVFAQVRVDGNYESGDAYAADALVNMARTTLDTFTEVSDGDARPDASDCGSSADADDAPPGEEHDAEERDAEDEQPEDPPRNTEDFGDRDGGGPSAPGPSDAPPAGPGGNHDHARPADRSAGVGPTLRSRSRRPRSRPQVVLNIRVDHTAFRRGYTEAGEVCELNGLGPVSVDLARHAAEDAFIRLHLVDGDRVIDTRNVGRTIPTRLRLALEERDQTCCVPGCDATRHLEIHHVHPVALGGPTTLANLCRICPRHHDQITNQGASITGDPGAWTWTPPGTGRPAPTDGAPPDGGPPSEGPAKCSPTTPPPEPVELKLL